MLTSILVRKIRSFLREPVFVKCWFLPVWLLLGTSKAIISMVSFRLVAPRLGRHAGATPWLPLLTGRQAARALQIGRTVRLAARYTPWDSHCFPQAVAARLLLGLYDIPYALFFGLTRDQAPKEIKAHAWVAAGKVRVTGGNSFDQFTVVGCFVAPQFQGLCAP